MVVLCLFCLELLVCVALGWPIVAALLVGLLRARWGIGYWRLCFAMALGTAGCYFFGTVWFMAVTGTGIWTSLVSCVFPFLAGDALKIALAAYLARRLAAPLRTFGGEM